MTSIAQTKPAILTCDCKELAYHISPEPGPDFLTTSGIQKGLILHYRGRPLCQEGLGFGVPIIRSNSNTYFSKTATLTRGPDQRIEKTYHFDCISRIKICAPLQAQPVFITKLFEKIVTLYMRHKSLQPALLKALQIAQKTFRGSCVFVDTGTIGTATVTYDVRGSAINITSAFHTSLPQPVFTMANEQGAGFFDAALVDGEFIADKNIRGWLRATRAKYVSTAEKLSFALEETRDKSVFLGRECNKFLHWSGINLESCDSSFDYVVRVEATQ